MIEIKDLHKSYAAKVLFEDCSLRLGARDRLGLIGPNGSGKTTLLRMIAGEESPDRGDIFLRRGAHIGYLSQEPMPVKGRSILEEVQGGVKDLATLEEKMRLLEEELSEERDEKTLETLAKAYGQLEERFAHRGGYGIEAQGKRILLGLGFREEDFGRFPEELSGGWRMRLDLAKLLLATPDVLLLDEPTNHLDLEALIWVEEFLDDYLGTVMLVSHDRDFLNRVVNKILAIEGRKISVYVGNYEAYGKAREMKITLQEAAVENQRKKIEQTARFVERFRYKATKAKQVQSRLKSLKKLERVEVFDLPRTIHFQFPQPTRSGRSVVELKEIHKAYGPVKVYSGVNLALSRGDKMALVGTNGAGKTTLLKLMAGVLEPEQGAIAWGHNVTQGYFAQHQLELLEPTRTVWEEIFALAQDEPLSFLRGLLGAFLFSGEEVDKKVSVLSGGEKSRLVLAKMLMRPANFLLLDEPTNHLDIAAREVLERALQQFQGTIGFITHDRHLINAIANKVVEVQDGSLTEYLGNYDDYLYKKELEIKVGESERGPGILLGKMGAKERSTRKDKEQKRTEAEARNLFYRETKELRERIQEIEGHLEAASRERELTATQLADPEVYRGGEKITELLKTHAAAKKRVEELTSKWEGLSQKLEDLGVEPNEPPLNDN